MRISDWSSDVCSSDLDLDDELGAAAFDRRQLDGAADLLDVGAHHVHADAAAGNRGPRRRRREAGLEDELLDLLLAHGVELGIGGERSDEHTSELQSLMRISYAVFCLKKQKCTKHN